MLLLREANLTRTLFKTIAVRKLRFFGHAIRHSILFKTTLLGKIEGRRQRGRQRHTWATNIQQWSGLSTTAAVRAADDRIIWHTIAVKPRIGDGT